jgi:hypothetical protein
MKKLLTGIFALLMSVIVFSSCSDDESTTAYIYNIGITDTSYSGSGNPTDYLNYLTSLHIETMLTYTEGTQEEANQKAMAKFNSEMAKISVDKLNSFGNCYIVYELSSANLDKTIAKKTFGSK